MLTMLIILAVVLFGLLAGAFGYYLAIYRLEQAFRLRQEMVRDQAKREADAEWERLLPKVREEVSQETAAAWQEEVAAARTETREAVNKEWSERVADLLEEARAEVERDWQKRVAAVREEARLAAERDRPARPVVAEVAPGPASARETWAGQAVAREGAAAGRLERGRSVGLGAEIERQKDRFARKAQERRAARERTEVTLAAPASVLAGPHNSSGGTTADMAAVPGRSGLAFVAPQPEPVAPILTTPPPSRESGLSADPGETLIQQLTRRHLREGPTPPASR